MIPETFPQGQKLRAGMVEVLCKLTVLSPSVLDWSVLAAWPLLHSGTTSAVQGGAEDWMHMVVSQNKGTPISTHSRLSRQKKSKAQQPSAHTERLCVCISMYTPKP